MPGYLLLMVLELLNIDLTHLCAWEILIRGALSIRTKKHFARSAIDLTLEQTVNANAASRKTGISTFTISEEGRHKWMLTQSVRSQITSNLLEMARIKRKEYSMQELQALCIRKDNEDQQKIMNQIQETLNTFKEESDVKNLYCLTTGKAESEGMKQNLLGCKDYGHKRCETFKDECL